MPRVLDLADVLQLVVEGLDEHPLSKYQFVPEAHQTIFPVFAYVGEECEPLRPEDIMQHVGNRAPIPEGLAKEPLGEAGDGAAVIDMPWSEPKGQECSLIIDDEMQCEAKEPAHGRLVPRRPALADLMTGNAAVMTDG